MPTQPPKLSSGTSPKNSGASGAQRSAFGEQQVDDVGMDLPQEMIQRAFVNPQMLSSTDILQLQRTMGNRAVSQLLGRERTNSSIAHPTGQLASVADVTPPIGAEGGVVNGNLEAEIRQAKGGGNPVPPIMRKAMENQMGISYSDVRIHTDAKADRLSRNLNAEAFTLGTNAYFRKGAYNPTSHSGKRLLTHELTHVAQQRAGNMNRVQPKLRVGPANDKVEREADHVATQLQVSPTPHAASTNRVSWQHVTPNTVKHTVQRKMNFDPKQLSEEKSMTHQFRDLTNKVGIQQQGTAYKKIITAVDDYWATSESWHEVILLDSILGLIDIWTENHANSTSKQDTMKGITLEVLRQAALQEKPKALAQQQYMDDLETTTNTENPQQGPKPFQFMSELARMFPTQQGKGLARGETSRDAGQSKTALALVKKYKLTDAEIAAIKIYTVDDYKYINPAKAGVDSWLKGNLEQIDGLSNERGGVGIVLEGQGSSAKMKIDAGIPQVGHNVLVLDGKTIVGRGTIKSLTRLNHQTGSAQPQRSGQSEEVNLQITGYAALKKDDKIKFVDESDESVAQAKLEGLRHGKVASKGLKKLPDRKGEVYRGMTITPEEMADKYQVGKTVNYPNFTSTTKNRAYSMGFIRRELSADKGKGGQKVGMLLRLDVQENGKNVEDLSLAMEEEVLLLPGTKFQVETNPVSTAEGEMAFYDVRAKQIALKTPPSQNPTKGRKGDKKAQGK